MNGQPTLVHEKLVRFPALSVGRPAYLARQSAFKRGDTRDLATQMERTIEEALWLGRTNHFRAVTIQIVDTWDLIHQAHITPGRHHAARTKHTGMCVIRHLAPSISGSNGTKS